MTQAPKVKKLLNPTDKHVGSRVRMRRLMLDVSQQRLGDALGLTFQQVQKYEKGTNRIGAGRLQQLAHILQVPIAFFFEGAPDVPGLAATRGSGRYGVALRDRPQLRAAVGLHFIPCSLRRAPRRTPSAGAGVESFFAKRWSAGDVAERQLADVADRARVLRTALEVTLSLVRSAARRAEHHRRVPASNPFSRKGGARGMWLSGS
jgi:transcriptional regulator with XRE-family HTH domain